MNRKRKIQKISSSMSLFNRIFSIIPFTILNYCNRNDILKITILNKNTNKIINKRFNNNVNYYIERRRRMR